MIFSREAGGNRSMNSASISAGKCFANARDTPECSEATAIRLLRRAIMFSWFIGFSGCCFCLFSWHGASECFKEHDEEKGDECGGDQVVHWFWCW